MAERFGEKRKRDRIISDSVLKRDGADTRTEVRDAYGLESNMMATRLVDANEDENYGFIGG